MTSCVRPVGHHLAVGIGAQALKRQDADDRRGRRPRAPRHKRGERRRDGGQHRGVDASRGQRSQGRRERVRCLKAALGPRIGARGR